MDFLLLILGLALLWVGTDLAILGAIAISRYFRLSEFVVGIAVLSIGSDLPELTIAIDAGIRGLAGIDASDVVVGSSVGSSMGQIGLVLGIVGLIGYLTIPTRIIYQHGGVRLGSILILAAVAMDGTVTRVEGATLLIVYSIYFVLLLTDKRSYEKPDDDEQELGFRRASVYVGIGLVGVTLGAELTIRAVSSIATTFNVNEALIALFVVGVGTSLPELSISVGAILKKRSRLSVGNLIGSNIFDTLVPVGAAAAIAGLRFDSEVLSFDVPFLFVLSVVVLFFFVHKRGLQKSEALIVLCMYIAYLVIRLHWI